MISRQHIAQWGTDHPWPFNDQIEQDLLLAQAICAIANDALLSDELVLRGGTAFHKLFLPEPLRYSEDLDYVRTTASGIGDVMKRLTALGNTLGYEVRTEMGKYPKVHWRYIAESGSRMKIKIEINTFERSPMLPLQRVPMSVASTYCQDEADVNTFQPEELIATKIRALYQRSKGRDLFDMWLALTSLSLDPHAIVDALPAYRPDGLTRESLTKNLQRKLTDAQFRDDIGGLVRKNIVNYDIDAAADLVERELIRLI